jgi:hypothetical protein
MGGHALTSPFAQFDEVWSLGPGDLETAFSWQVEAHMPAGPPNGVGAGLSPMVASENIDRICSEI